MTQIEQLINIATILKNLPDTVSPAGTAEWKELPGVPFGLPLGKPLEYMRIANITSYRKPSKPVVFTPSTVQAIINGQPVGDFTHGKTMNVIQMLDYLGFTDPVKLAKVILKEYELELELNDLPDDATVGNSWLPGVVHEGKTVALELLLGYDGYCGYGVSVSRVDVAWQAYEEECRKNNEPIDWSMRIKPNHQLFIRPSFDLNGLTKAEEMTVPEFLEYLGEIVDAVK